MAFLSSCVFVFVSFGGGGYARLFAGLFAADKTVRSVLFVHVLAYTEFGALLAALVLFLIGWPLYLARGGRWRNSAAECILTGFVIGLLIIGLLIGWEIKSGPMPSAFRWFEVIAIIITSPVAALTFWFVRFRLLREPVAP